MHAGVFRYSDSSAMASSHFAGFRVEMLWLTGVRIWSRAVARFIADTLAWSTTRKNILRTDTEIYSIKVSLYSVALCMLAHSINFSAMKSVFT